MNGVEERQERDKNHDILCCVCGYWITRYEYGGYFKGTYVDYTQKTSGECTITVCNECMRKMLQYLETEL